MTSDTEPKKEASPFSSISFRLLFYIILVSSFFTLISTAIQLYVDYRKDVSLIRAAMTQIQESYVESISHHLWNLDDDGLRTQLKGILTLRDIQYVAVHSTEAGLTIAVGSPDPKQSLWMDFPVFHSGFNLNERIGTLEVAASMAGVYQRLREKVLVILGTQTIKTFVVSIIILFLIRQMITRHLNSMGRFAAGLDLNRLDDALVLKGKARRKKPDELDLVMDAVNSMRLSLKKSLEETRVKARMEGELGAAATVQRSLMPKHAPQVIGFDIAATFIPAREVSGDFFDFMKINANSLGIVVADAAGKGMAAALHANTARVLIKDKPQLFASPKNLMQALNRSLAPEMQPKQFITMSYMTLDSRSGEVNYVNAGHEPGLYLAENASRIRQIKPHGFPFSQVHTDLFDDRMEMVRHRMQSGDIAILYTDGVTDAMNKAGEMFGEERFYRQVIASRNKTADELIADIRMAIREFQESVEPTDDITIVVVKRL